MGKTSDKFQQRAMLQYVWLRFQNCQGQQKQGKSEKKQENLKEKHEEIQHLNITRDPRTEKDTGLKSNDIWIYYGL